MTVTLPIAATLDHEVKFVLDAPAVTSAISMLGSLCRIDPEFPAATIHSFYYDTRDWDLLSGKTESQYLKSKIRLRWYSDLATGHHSEAVFAEVKRKEGGLRRKGRVRAPRTGAEYSQADPSSKIFAEIPPLLREAGLVLHTDYFPSFQISYKRRRYIEPFTNTRIAIDYDIYVPRVNPNLMPRANTSRLSAAVIEAKGSLRRLPERLMPLLHLGIRKEAFSKYLECHTNLVSPLLGR